MYNFLAMGPSCVINEDSALRCRSCSQDPHRLGTASKTYRALSSPRSFRSILQFGYVGCLQALWAALDSKLNPLAFFERAESLSLDGAVVDKHVLAVLTRDEAVSLRAIEPLDGPGHTVAHS